MTAVIRETSTFPIDRTAPEPEWVQSQPENFKKKFLTPIVKVLGNETTNKIVNDTTVIVKDAVGRIATQVGSDFAGGVAGKKMIQVATALLT